jgi:hypothetical protein
MTSVFIGGSRAVSRLNSVIREKLDDLIARNCAIYVGDAKGADKAIQQHLADRQYQHVTVYCMECCRNNVGAWPTKRISYSGKPKDFACYAAKDLAMEQDGKYGLMLWDGRSKGTLNNIQNLLRMEKKTLAYLGIGKAFHKLSSDEDLQHLLDRCDLTAVANAQRQIQDKLSVQEQTCLNRLLERGFSQDLI